MTESSVRGAGQARAGATDTTMLIWKVIAANPGITRQEIWEQVKHGIPQGYALRVLRHENDRQNSSRRSFEEYARSRVLTRTLASMKYQGMIAKDGGCFRVLREPRYMGNADAIDETGTKAAEHMAVADALRRLEKMAVRAKLDREHARTGRCITGGLKDYEALVLLVKAFRAQGRAET